MKELLRQILRRYVLDTQIAVDDAVSFRAARLIPEYCSVSVAEFYAGSGVVPIALAVDGLMEQHSWCCNQSMSSVIYPSRGFFIRNRFSNKDVFEHAAETPMKFKDKYHLQDHCEEVGIRSRLLEDGDV